MTELNGFSTKDNNKKSKTKAKSKDKDKDKGDKPKKSKFIHKYTANGSIPLHESIIVSKESIFACYAGINGGAKLQLFKSIQLDADTNLYPMDTITSQNPLPYAFESLSVQLYLQLLLLFAL